MYITAFTALKILLHCTFLRYPFFSGHYLCCSHLGNRFRAATNRNPPTLTYRAMAAVRVQASIHAFLTTYSEWLSPRPPFIMQTALARAKRHRIWLPFFMPSSASVLLCYGFCSSVPDVLFCLQDLSLSTCICVCLYVCGKVPSTRCVTGFCLGRTCSLLSGLVKHKR